MCLEGFEYLFSLKVVYKGVKQIQTSGHGLGIVLTAPQPLIICRVASLPKVAWSLLELASIAQWLSKAIQEMLIGFFEVFWNNSVRTGNRSSHINWSLESDKARFDNRFSSWCSHPVGFSIYLSCLHATCCSVVNWDRPWVRNILPIKQMTKWWNWAWEVYIQISLYSQTRFVRALPRIQLQFLVWDMEMESSSELLALVVVREMK